MAFQHREFQARLRDAERLRLYAQSAFSDQKALSASLMEAESNSRLSELEAREAMERKFVLSRRETPLIMKWRWPDRRPKPGHRWNLS